MAKSSFLKEVFKIAIPVALQSMLQSSFSMIDQIMVGQLGEKSIAAVEIAGKPGFIYAFVLGAVGTIAGIMISQYIGKEDCRAEEKSVCVNLAAAVLTGAVFLFISVLFSNNFVSLFSTDRDVISQGTAYLKYIGWAFIPMGVSNILGVAVRCRGRSSWPLYIGVISAVINTGFNYILIFGKLGVPALGVIGAAYASVLSQIVGAILSMVFFMKLYGRIGISFSLGRDGYLQYFAMLFPVVINEFLWSVGQSINTFVYGHMGTEELAGMSITGSVQGLTIGALSGLSQAAGILTGKSLGEMKYERAYDESKKLCVYGFIGSLCLSALMVLLRFPYVGVFRVSGDVRTVGADIMIAFALLLPVKVQNMVLGGGIIRSGGRTKYIMIIDMIGTWLIGVPLVLLSGLVWKLPIVWVYFITSQEEMVRFLITIFMFRSRKWMNTIE
ncbi:MAG: MATE family efflux transporter [Lachnospiraceae bacterium]|nr:MATE family efflux transporter [Lachnospiraceae bacterium]